MVDTRDNACIASAQNIYQNYLSRDINLLIFEVQEYHVQLAIFAFPLV